VTPSAKREAIAILVEEFGLSISRACRIVRFSRAAQYRTPRSALDRDAEVITALNELVDRHPSIGFWSCYDRLRLRQLIWNHKRVHRVYCAMRLNLPRKAKRRVPNRLRQPLVAPSALNQVWALDFMSDAVYGGGKLRTLNIIDEANREVLAIEVSTSIPTARVLRVLNELVALYGVPAALRTDNGPEFTSGAMAEWCQGRGIEMKFIQPGKPNQNAYVERFNRSYRRGVLDAYVFESIEEVRAVTAEWVQDYNSERPHDSLGGRPPKTFMPRLQTRDESSSELSR
jgi:putative transposase